MVQTLQTPVSDDPESNVFIQQLLETLETPRDRRLLEKQNKVVENILPPPRNFFVYYARKLLSRVRRPKISQAKALHLHILHASLLRDIHKGWFNWLAHQEHFPIPDCELSERNKKIGQMLLDENKRDDSPGLEEIRERAKGVPKWEHVLEAVRDTTISLVLSGFHFSEIYLDSLERTQSIGTEKRYTSLDNGIFSYDDHAELQTLKQRSKTDIKILFGAPMLELETFVATSLVRLCMDCEDYLKENNLATHITPLNFDAICQTFTHYTMQLAAIGRAHNLTLTLHNAYSDKPFNFKGDVTKPSDIEFAPPDLVRLGQSLATMPSEKLAGIVSLIIDTATSSYYTGCPALYAKANHQGDNFVRFSLKLHMKAIKTTLFTRPEITPPVPSLSGSRNSRCPFSQTSFPSA